MVREITKRLSAGKECRRTEGDEGEIEDEEDDLMIRLRVGDEVKKWRGLGELASLKRPPASWMVPLAILELVGLVGLVGFGVR